MPDSQSIILRKGLTLEEAERARLKYGENTLSIKKKESSVIVFIKKFNSPLLLLLIIASCVAIVLGQHTDAVIILVMVFISVVLDFTNTQKSEKAVQELIDKVAVTVTVLRNGAHVDIPVRQVVPGDIVILNAGSIIPADCKILEVKDFFVNQSALTGESFPVEKRPIREADTSAPTLESECYVFMGSSVISGYAIVEVVAIGHATHYGKIAKQLNTHVRETDFEKGIRSFSYFILQIIMVLVVLLFFINTIMHRGIFESFIFALAVAIGLTPELLPIVISIGLSHGSLLMAKKNVIVKKLSAIENFGSMNVLCTDKTGTLTEDKITLVRHVDGFGKESEKTLFYSYINSIFHTGIQNPLDMAIRDFKILDVSHYEKIDEIPFDFSRRRASIIAQNHGERVLIAKGAPEEIFSICTMCQKEDDCIACGVDVKKTIHAQFDALSKDGFRVLAVAYKELHDANVTYTKNEEQGMTFLGFMAFYDPPKATAAEAVKNLEELGIEIKIITGDSALLTEKICRDIHLSVKGIVEGSAIDILSDEALQKLALKTTIFARANPAQKERIIIALKCANCSVGYLGDGINDAPALKAADVGISVNNAVDVAKHTADIILLKKNLIVLRDGVIEGRKTFQNTMKYIMMGLSSNFGNMFSMTGLSVILPFFPMLPSQILLNNLLYDISQFTISTDSVDAQDVQKPLRWNVRFIRKYMISLGPVSSIFDFLTFGIMWYVFHPTVAQFQTAWFIESLATQTLVIYIVRTRNIPFLQSVPSKWLLASTLGVVAVGWILPFTSFGSMLAFSPLSPLMLGAIAGIIFVYLLMVQVAKVIFYRYIAGEHAPHR
jgi:Mg2+-importing ATPase